MGTKGDSSTPLITGTTRRNTVNIKGCDQNGIAADKTKGLPWASPRWPFSSVPRNDLGNVVGLQQQYRRGDPGPSNSGGLGDPSRFRLNGYDGTGMYQPQNPLPDNDNQVFNEEHQMKMSFRQLNYDRLSSQEKKEQDNWAHSELARLVPCPMGYGWRRVRGGYRCKGGENTPKNAESLRTGGTHLVTDELLSRRQGEFYLLSVFVRHYEKTVQFPGIKGRWTGPETINSFRVQKQLQAKYGRQYGDAPGGPPMYRYDQFGRIQGQSPFNRNEGRRL